MKLSARLTLGGLGALLLFYSLGMLRRGRFVYRNSYGQDIFPSGVVAIGCVLIVLALLPLKRSKRSSGRQK